MKDIRRIVLLATLGATAFLTLLSIIGAFLGVEGARELFNSRPMVIYWVLIAALLSLGFIYFRKLVSSPGTFAVHLGPLLILVGAMYGSQRGHVLAATYLGLDRVPQGYMRIFEGEASNVITDEVGRQIATLPFKIRLEDFWLEYYDAPGPWRLGIDAPSSGHEKRRRMSEISWEIGEETKIPFIDGTIEVLRYLPSARPEFAEGEVPTLEVVESDGRRSVVPAKVGQEFELGSSEGRLKVIRVFNHLQIRNGEVIDIPGSTANPAVKVLLENRDGSISHRYAFARADLAGHSNGENGLRLYYVLPSESGAVADPESGLPAMEVKVRSREGDEMRGWLVARDHQQPVVLSLAPILRLSKRPGGQHHHPDNAYLMLVGQEGAVRDYFSRLTVLDETGQSEVEKVIEVNDPLHFGGYHFYQHSYDNQAGRFTVLSVRSDAGLSMVYLGFGLLCCGVFWLFWVRPLWGHLKSGE